MLLKDQSVKTVLMIITPCEITWLARLSLVLLGRLAQPDLMVRLIVLLVNWKVVSYRILF